MEPRYQAIVIGVSAGGIKALQTVLPVLRRPSALSVLVVQHLWRNADGYLPQSLDGLCQLTVKEAEEKELIKADTIYLAPANYHLMLENDKTLSLSVDKRVNYSRPSVDVLFESAADVFGAGVIGVVLTGANDDGSRGLQSIKDAGGVAIVQDPATAEVDIMPQAAIDRVNVDYVLPLAEIGPLLLKFTENSTAGA